VPEVRLLHPCGDDQHVEVETERGLVGAARDEAARISVEIDRIAKQRHDVGMARQLFAQTTADLPNAQRPGSALIKQRLEHVLGRAIKQDDLDISTAQTACAEKSAEAAPDDHHPQASVAHLRG
jgi:hypothetical protein